MGLFDLFRRPDINEGLRAYREEKAAVLLDVRSREEYTQGHIPGSRNLPLQEIGAHMKKQLSVETPLYVYCLSGGRSAQAAALLKRLGYAGVRNIGGIAGYHGKLEG